jgi:hypothetical protein
MPDVEATVTKFSFPLIYCLFVLGDNLQMSCHDCNCFSIFRKQSYELESWRTDSNFYFYTHVKDKKRVRAEVGEGSTCVKFFGSTV